MAFAYFTLQRGRDPSPQAPTTSSEQISNTPEPNYRYAGADDERLEIEEEQTNHINSNQRTVTSSAHKVIILSNQVHDTDGAFTDSADGNTGEPPYPVCLTNC